MIHCVDIRCLIVTLDHHLLRSQKPGSVLFKSGIKFTCEKLYAILSVGILYFYQVASNSLLGVIYSKSFNYRELIKYAMQGGAETFVLFANPSFNHPGSKRYQEYLSKL